LYYLKNRVKLSHLVLSQGPAAPAADEKNSMEHCEMIYRKREVINSKTVLEDRTTIPALTIMFD
jgi:hypothetical protein